MIQLITCHSKQFSPTINFVGFYFNYFKRKMKIIQIVACAENNVIGKDNQMLWKLSDDLKHFKQTTNKSCVIMGRKTFESIGKALKDRINIVITSKKSINYKDSNVFTSNSIQLAIEFCNDLMIDKCFIIGGGEIYKQTLSITDEIILTKVKTEIEGDTFYPELDNKQWIQLSKQSFNKNDKNDFDFDIINLIKA